MEKGQFKLTKTGYQDAMQTKDGEKDSSILLRQVARIQCNLKMEKRTVQVN
jgi:hypothetical protein